MALCLGPSELNFVASSRCVPLSLFSMCLSLSVALCASRHPQSTSGQRGNGRNGCKSRVRLTTTTFSPLSPCAPPDFCQFSPFPLPTSPFNIYFFPCLHNLHLFNPYLLVSHVLSFHPWHWSIHLSSKKSSLTCTYLSLVQERTADAGLHWK